MEIILAAWIEMSQPRLIPRAVKPEIAMEKEETNRDPHRGSGRRD